jgi:Zn-dependent membrane protease YugP
MLFGWFYYDWTILIVLPALIISIIAQAKVSSAYKKYAAYSTRNVTGYAAARAILDSNGLSHVAIERVRGHLTDHYDPKTNVIRLSDSVYDAANVAAVGVAAHEAGHAVQYAFGYAPIKLRMAIIPVTRFGSMMAVPLFMIGLLMASESFMVLGIVLYAAVTLFQLVTLPVEFNASRRAMNLLSEREILFDDELPKARKVLTAAAMTYVASLLVSLMSLIRLILRTRRD